MPVCTPKSRPESDVLVSMLQVGRRRQSRPLRAADGRGGPPQRRRCWPWRRSPRPRGSSHRHDL